MRETEWRVLGVSTETVGRRRDVGRESSTYTGDRGARWEWASAGGEAVRELLKIGRVC